MHNSNLGPVPAGLSPKKDVTAEGGAHSPMSQQNAADCHGHEMHPQKFVRLVGCHESNAGSNEAARHLH